MPEGLILVGRVAGAFGVKGELRLTAYTAQPQGLIAYGPLRGADGSIVLTTVNGRVVKGGVVVTAREVGSREEAEGLRGRELFIERSALPAPDPDEFYLADLIGLAVISPGGAHLGTVKSVGDFGAGDLLEIEPAQGGATWWAPFSRAVVPQVRLAEGLIIVERPAEDA